MLANSGDVLRTYCHCSSSSAVSCLRRSSTLGAAAAGAVVAAGATVGGAAVVATVGGAGLAGGGLLPQADTTMQIPRHGPTNRWMCTAPVCPWNLATGMRQAVAVSCDGRPCRGGEGTAMHVIGSRLVDGLRCDGVFVPGAGVQPAGDVRRVSHRAPARPRR